MKTLILSDFHGESPFEFVNSIGGLGRIVFLGDWDEPELLEEALERDFGAEKIFLIGNHDYEFCLGEEISSPRLKRSFEQYQRDWRNSSAYDFVKKSAQVKKGIRRGISVVRRVGEKKVAFVHGTLSALYPSHEANPMTWGRLKEEYFWDFCPYRVAANFREMINRNIWVLFRGHDHMSEIFENPETQASDSTHKQVGKGAILDKRKRYIVSIGEFYCGDYCLFDDETGKVELKRR